MARLMSGATVSAIDLEMSLPAETTRTVGEHDEEEQLKASRRFLLLSAAALTYLRSECTDTK